MIYFRSKHPYSDKSKRWFKMLYSRTYYDELDFEDYSYIIGDKIYHEDSPEAKSAFNKVKMWMELGV